MSAALLDPGAEGEIRVLMVCKDDPDLDFSDPRAFCYRGEVYLTTLSHLRLAWSDDGIHFQISETPTLTELKGRFYLSFSAVSPDGVGLVSTSDSSTFEHHGMILPPHNKGCSLFSERVGERYYALHRPSGLTWGGTSSGRVSRWI